MVQTVSRSAYRDQLHGLMPRGAAWPRDPGTVLDALLEATAASYATLDARAVGLLEDGRPDTTVTLLADWERLLALPDDCSPADSTFDQRRRAVIDKVSTPVNLSTRTYLDLARLFGYHNAEVVEMLQPAAEAVAGPISLDISAGKWRYMWWLALNDEGQDVDYFDTLSGVDEPLAAADSPSEVTCRIRQMTPAHTHAVIAWASPHPKAPEGFAGSWRNAQTITLTWTPVSQSWATGYEYRRRVGGTSAWSAWTAIAGGRTTRSVLVGMLTGTNAYDFQIRTRFSGGVRTRYVDDSPVTDTSGESAPSDTLSVAARD